MSKKNEEIEIVPENLISMKVWIPVVFKHKGRIFKSDTEVEFENFHEVKKK